MTTRISKGRDGYEARTTIELGFDRRVLVINTHKTTGGLVTAHTVMKQDDHGYMSYILFQDFTKRTVFKGARCTEKNVKEIHQQALDVSDLTMSEAAKFYGHIESSAAEDIDLSNLFANVPSMNEFQGVAA